MTAKKPKVKSQKLKVWKAVVFFVLAAFLGAGKMAGPGVLEEAGTLIVKIKKADHEPILSRYGKPEHLFENFYRVKVADIHAALADLALEAAVESVQRDQGLKATALFPTDPLYTADATSLMRQWYLPKLEVTRAWDLTTGGSVTIAVVDTGIDGKHEDLSDGRVGRGFASYCQVRSPTSDLECSVRVAIELAAGANSDDNGHGTIVAGMIGAIPNNNKGMTGINWNIRLMPIKILDEKGSGFASDLALGIRWAADSGAQIINLSIGGDGLSGDIIIKEAVSYAFKKGVLLVAAAGNDSAEEGINLNTNPTLPVCADTEENMIVGVAAVDAADKKAKFSNYGSNCVDIAAPGTGTFIDKLQKQGLVSTYFDPARPSEHNLYVYGVGTSVAAPMVSAVAGLILSINSGLDVKTLRDRLLVSVDNIDEPNRSGCGADTCVSQIGRGRINALKAVMNKSPFVEGALLRDELGHIYIIEKNLRRQVSEFVQKQRFALVSPTEVTEKQLASVPLGPALPPIDGTLLKAPDIPTAYIVEEGRLYALSYTAFISRNLRFSDISTVPQTEIAGYPLQGDGAILNGVLIKSRDHPAIYVVNNGVRQLLSFFVWQQRFSGSQVAELSLEEVQKFAANDAVLYPPDDETLLKSDSEPLVYLIQEGKRRGLNSTAFFNHGYNFSQVKVLPQSEVDGYARGSDIME